MAIMFAGGMTIAAPSIMPGAAADFGVSDGQLSVSSEFIQGASILEIVVNDPDLSASGDNINNGAEVTIGGTSYDMVQGVNGKWYLYVVDQSISALLDADAKGMEFGVQCTKGMGTNGSANIIASGTTVWTEAVPNNGLALADGNTSVAMGPDVTTAMFIAGSGGSGSNTTPGYCLDLDGMTETNDTGTATPRSKLSASVLQDAPTLSDHDDTQTDLGQRLHALNSSGYGSWPYILAIELNSDNIIEYGSDMVNVEFGNTDDEASITLTNQNPAGYHEIHLTVTDPGLNLDPTFADIWILDAAAESDSTSVLIFANNGTNLAMTEAERGEMQCSENCRLYNASGVLHDSVTGPDGLAKGSNTVKLTESSENSGVFESFDLNGESEIEVLGSAASDGVIVWDYAGETVDMIITYNDAGIDFSSDGDWVSGSAVSVTINDPDMNFNPLSDETLDVGDERRVIPTIVMGSPKTLADGSNSCLNGSMGQSSSGTQMSANLCGMSNLATAGWNGPGGQYAGGVNVGADSGGSVYGLAVYNTTDNSKRLKIVHNGTVSGGTPTGVTNTWVNVTTGHTRADIIGMPGTPYLSWDISGPAGLVSATDINVYVTDAGSNASDNGTTGIITVVDSGAVTQGFADLDDGTQSITDQAATFTGTGYDVDSTTSTDVAGTSELDGNTRLTVAFQLTHADGDGLTSTAEYAIAADFCSFDQNNASGTAHNCIYRLEAEETGNNTGIFEGTVEYITLNPATAGTGGHGGDHTELDSTVTVSDVDTTIVLQDSVSGVDAVRLIYNDTDSAGGGDELGKQIDTVTHTGTATLDADDYEDTDTATITIVDMDLNQDSSIRDTYTNSSSTFKMTITGAGEVTQQPFATNPMTIIETTNDSGIFVGTFTVPNFNGEDMELTYYEARDAGGNDSEIYDTATITSNAGSVSFDRSVYPVPFVAGDIEDGAGTDISSIAGAVTMLVVVSDADHTDETLTTGGSTGTISIKLIEAGSDGQECFTAGGTTPLAFTGDTVEELGPLYEITRDSSEFEVEFTLDKVQDCGASDITVSSGDVIQVKYTDVSDDTGSSSSVYDSATFDMRTGQLSVDKDVYVLGSDMVVTLTDADLNLDSGSTETYILDLIEWDSDADSSELLSSTNDFTNNPSNLQETGDDTGVFQTVTTLPTVGIKEGATSSQTDIDFGEAVTLTYNDQSLSGEDQVGDDELDVETYFSISNFGALVELDKAVYSWTDVVYFTITAPDHNRNTASEEQIGTATLPIQITTRKGKLCTSTYLADESGPDTGVFEGEVELAGFAHTMSSDGTARTPATEACGNTNDGGVIQTDSQTDGISVSFEYNDAEVVVASASIVWQIGEAYFDSSAVSVGGSALVTVIDEDENLDDDIIDTFTIDVFSDSDNGGFNLTMSETNEDTGVFEGTIFFTDDAATSGTNIRVSEGDTVTAEYTDETLPEPYTTDDDLVIAATTTVGTAFPPLERAPAANARVVDAFGASVAEVTVDQQVQIAADVSNGQSGDQAFAYLVQVQDSDGVTVSLAWITGSLTAGQSMSPALSWTPDASGSYTATVFVWESVDNPTALSPTVSVSIDVV
jgi:hypothetical protein